MTALTLLISFEVSLVTIDVSKYDIRYFANNRPVKHMVCNEVMAKPLIQALECVHKKEKALGKKILHNYAGCYVNRYIHGTTKYSQHAFGLAIDVNVSVPADRYTDLTSPELVSCFKETGFIWGGDWKNKDYMHFEFIIRS
jgi:hypothetical protein